jgi:uncharacterized protein
METCFPDFTPESGCQFSGPIQIEIHSTKMGEDFLLKIKVYCTGELICDRCAANFNQIIDGELQILFTTDLEKVKDAQGDEVKYISPVDREIDLTQDVIDALFLSIPVKRLCREECKGLCAQCGINLNIENCNCSQKEIDPRWRALQDLDFDE